MPIPKQLSPDRAKRTLIAKLSGNANKVGLVDRIRQIATNLGDRPYCLDLVWTRWSGAEIGLGDETELARFPLLPNPLIKDVNGILQNPFSAGILPVGTLRVSEISAGQTTEDLLRGFVLNDRSTPRPDDVDFFYELRGDGRNQPPNTPAQRHRFRLLGTPSLDADNVQYVILLERSSVDPSRNGTGVP